MPYRGRVTCPGDHAVIVVDPKAEFGPLAQQAGGEAVPLATFPTCFRLRLHGIFKPPLDPDRVAVPPLPALASPPSEPGHANLVGVFQQILVCRQGRFGALPHGDQDLLGEHVRHIAGGEDRLGGGPTAEGIATQGRGRFDGLNVQFHIGSRPSSYEYRTQ